MAFAYLFSRSQASRRRSYEPVARYRSAIRGTLGKWIEKNYGRMKISDFTAEVAVEYMDYFYNDRKVVSKKNTPIPLSL